jgi:NAD(P)-dependent dehydrogenase (short-subunit alcohol dehydrogenase family)
MALVTGGTGGMGRVIAARLAADGFDVAVAYTGSIDLVGATVKEIAGHGRRGAEWDPGARRQLGNTPQAFSHFALIISALQLHMGSAVRSDNPMGHGESALPAHQPQRPGAAAGWLRGRDGVHVPRS